MGEIEANVRLGMVHQPGMVSGSGMLDMSGMSKEIEGGGKWTTLDQRALS